MALEDIIKEETNRLFIIDRECYIIFTGSSSDEKKSFIRIGTYRDLPAEIIPLIENIGIPDIIIGNPAYEQFNIDVKNLQSNRYIGSRNIVAKYLDFQRLFGIDLKNANIVDVEKDIPTLTKERLTSSGDAFIGIFYTNGNLRIIHEGKTIFDLNDIEKISQDDIKIQDAISQVNGDTTRFEGNGIITLDNNLLFYKGGYFTSYQFPESYFSEFSVLSIDPQKIREIVQPSSNFIPITRFLKWKNSHSGRLSIFCDDSEAVELIGRLFPNLTLLRKNLKGLSFDTGGGLTMKNYSTSRNTKVTWEKTEPLKKDISIAYIVEPSGIGNIIKDSLDGIFINYSTYEDTNLIFKSVTTPVSVIDDGNRNISRLKGDRPVKLYHGIQYEMRGYNEIGEILQDIPPLSYLKDITATLSSNDHEEIKRVIAPHLSESMDKGERQIELFNATSVLKAVRDATNDRKLSAAINKTLYDLNTVEIKDILADSASSLKIILAFLKSSIYEYIVPVDGSKQDKPVVFDNIDEKEIDKFNRIPDPEIRDYYLRIIHDRKRLQELLSYYRPTEERDNDIVDLGEKIHEVERQYKQEDVPSSADTIQRNNVKKRRIKIGGIALIAIASLFILFLLIRGGVNYYRESQLREKLLLERKKEEILIKEYNIEVTDNEIFKYANEVAKRNGYKGISSPQGKEKNPHWIYPGNRFSLLDGETVTVVAGDTLWEISKRKIMKMHLEFYSTVNRIKERKKSKKNVEEDIERLKKLAFTDKHHRVISSMNGKKK